MSSFSWPHGTHAHSHAISAFPIKEMDPPNLSCSICPNSQSTSEQLLFIFILCFFSSQPNASLRFFHLMLLSFGCSGFVFGFLFLLLKTNPQWMSRWITIKRHITPAQFPESNKPHVQGWDANRGVCPPLQGRLWQCPYVDWLLSATCGRTHDSPCTFCLNLSSQTPWLFWQNRKWFCIYRLLSLYFSLLVHLYHKCIYSSLKIISRLSEIPHSL